MQHKWGRSRSRSETWNDGQPNSTSSYGSFWRSRSAAFIQLFISGCSDSLGFYPVVCTLGYGDFDSGIVGYAEFRSRFAPRFHLAIFFLIPKILRFVIRSQTSQGTISFTILKSGWYTRVATMTMNGFPAAMSGVGEKWRSILAILTFLTDFVDSVLKKLWKQQDRKNTFPLKIVVAMSNGTLIVDFYYSTCQSEAMAARCLCMVVLSIACVAVFIHVV